jgi:hypothetical protein
MRSLPLSRAPSPALNILRSNGGEMSSAVATSRASTSASRSRATVNVNAISNNVSTNGKSSSEPSDIWVSSVDPKSGRTFWYNR